MNAHPGGEGPPPPAPPLPPRAALGTVTFTKSIGWLAAMPTLAPTAAATGLASPVNMEKLGQVRLLKDPSLCVGSVSNLLYAAHGKALGQNYGWIVYSTTLPSFFGDSSGAVSGTLAIPDVRDRAVVFIDGIRVGTVYRVTPSTVEVTAVPGKSKITIAVENMVRVHNCRFLSCCEFFSKQIPHGVDPAVHANTSGSHQLRARHGS